MIDPNSYEVLDRRAAFLRGRARMVTSQFGEDGLIAALFEHIGTANRWCFEVGAADGFYLSNTWALRQAGWQAVLIEADDELYRACSLLQTTELVHCVHKRIGPDDLDEILSQCGAPLDLDLGVIDVDGPDVAIWGGLVRYRPRVMLVEYNVNGSGPLPGGVWQAGLDVVLAMGREKGYLPLARIGVNVLFMDSSFHFFKES